jgi:hypothetical protein
MAKTTRTEIPLLELKDKQTLEVEISPYMLQVSEFKELVRRDKGMKGDSTGRYKKRARAELAYIWLMCNPKSPFLESYDDESMRHTEVVNSLDLPDNWKVDDTVKNAIDKYQNLVEDSLTKLWESAKGGLNKLKTFLDNADLSQRDENGRPVYSVKEFRETINQIPKLAESIDNLEKKIRERESKEGQNYGGVQDTEFNE